MFFNRLNNSLTLSVVSRELECARSLDRALPDKVWFKQLFSIGVNEVTRLLERMPPVNDSDMTDISIWFKAILVAADCNPQWLTKHLPNLAASRRVPLFFVKDKKRASLRLGEVVKLKTAIAVGVKVWLFSIQLYIFFCLVYLNK
nr:Ribosomal protein L7Ae/L30e/S12e/Gadd45 [Ipomoea batatas]